jgi:hypothetical protein
VVPPSGVEPDPGLANRYDTATTVLEWRERLRFSHYGSHNVDVVVSGTKRR